MNCKELMNEIRKIQFAAVELNLYLDNFPKCKEAKEDYDKISAKLDKLICEYEMNYGPLTNFGSAFTENPVAWTKMPWPWEKQ
jgi:spore coat protein JB